MDNMYWIAPAVLLMAILGGSLGYIFARYRTAHERGELYALQQLYRAGREDEEVACHLAAQADDPFEPTAFDEGIMDVLLWFNDRRELRINALMEVVDTLNSMIANSEALPSETDKAVVAVGSLLEGSREEPSIFCVEYLCERDGETHLVRRPLRDWPTWAHELRGELYGHA